MNRDIGTMPFVYFFVPLGVTFFAQQFARVDSTRRPSRRYRVGVIVAAPQRCRPPMTSISVRTARVWGSIQRPPCLGKYMKTLMPQYQVWVGDTPYFPRDALTYLTFKGRQRPMERALHVAR